MPEKPFDLIAIDGPGGVGKSTVARLLAEKLDYFFLSTGLIYRAMAWFLAARGWDAAVPPDLTPLRESFSIRIDGEGRPWVAGVDPGEALRSEGISQAASILSLLPEVREKANQEQRETVQRIAAEGKISGVILEGRDIGTVVFPEAPHKFFLTASEEVRAERRFLEQASGAGAVTREAVRAGLRERDQRDSTREVAPLVPAPDALLVDTSALDLEQVVARVMHALGAPGARRGLP